MSSRQYGLSATLLIWVKRWNARTRYDLLTIIGMALRRERCEQNPDNH